jgi:hypothetical protein
VVLQSRRSLGTRWHLILKRKGTIQSDSLLISRAFDTRTECRLLWVINGKAFNSRVTKSGHFEERNYVVQKTIHKKYIYLYILSYDTSAWSLHELFFIYYYYSHISNTIYLTSKVTSILYNQIATGIYFNERCKRAAITPRRQDTVFMISDINLFICFQKINSFLFGYYYRQTAMPPFRHGIEKYQKNLHL